jgi:hypothetical protein
MNSQNWSYECHESRLFLSEKNHILFVANLFKGFDSMWVSKLEIATNHPLVHQVKKTPSCSSQQIKEPILIYM